MFGESNSMYAMSKGAISNAKPLTDVYAGLFRQLWRIELRSIGPGARAAQSVQRLEAISLGRCRQYCAATGQSAYQ
jgi:hypothetical protein